MEGQGRRFADSASKLGRQERSVRPGWILGRWQRAQAQWRALSPICLSARRDRQAQDAQYHGRAQTSQEFGGPRSLVEPTPTIGLLERGPLQQISDGRDGAKRLRYRAAWAMRVLIVDNRDSFTYNLSQLVAKVTSREPVVIANTDKNWRDLIPRHGLEAVVISPGPGSPDRPEDFGVCLDVIRECRLPLLGVCLGHQGLGYAYGARVGRAPAPMHGLLTEVTHTGDALFAGIPRTFQAVRYHSLGLQRESLPACLAVTATAADGVPMAIRHAVRPQFGVQFHPESVCAERGERLMRNFLKTRSQQDGEGPPRQGRSTRGVRSTRRSLQPDRPLRVVTKTLDQWTDPQAAFQRLFANSEHCFWLDSSEITPGRSRFSIMGDASGEGSSVLTYTTHDRILKTLRRGQWRTERIAGLLPHLRQLLRRPVETDAAPPCEFLTGLAGYFGYELRNELGSPGGRRSGIPDAALIDADRCLVFDHEERRVLLMARAEGRPEGLERWFDCVAREIASPAAGRPQGPRPSSGSLTATLADGPERYRRKIRECQEELKAGESYQICLSSEFEVDCELDPLAVYCALRSLNPAPYAAFLRFGSTAILSSSPERFLQVSAERLISAKPIKGTCARGADPAADARLAAWLRNDVKSRAENLMIADLLRNDIGRVAATASVRVPKLMEVESYATVHQLVSTVIGELRPDRDCLDCLAAAFPGGSMTGAPKHRTMGLIDRLEERARGPYAGAIGFLSFGDRMDLSIVIRTIVMAASGVSVASGGGIVALSNPQEEFEEMVLKARAPLQALATAATGIPDSWRLVHATP